MHKLTCPLAVMFLAAMAPMAHASLDIYYKIDLNPTVTCSLVPVANPNPSLSCPSVVGPPLSITLLGASSNAPGDTPTQENSATVNITNNDTVSHTVVINVVSTDFNTPFTPPTIEMLSHIGGSVAVGAAANSLNFISCIDTTNTQSAIAGCPAAFNAPTISPSITGAGSFQGDSNSLVSPLTANYAIDEQITLTLGARGSMNFSASTTLVQTPEPMSIVFLGSVVLLCSGLARRKLKGASQV